MSIAPGPFGPRVTHDQFAQRVRARMGELHLTQVQLGERVGTAQAVVGRWLSGSWPRPDVLPRLAGALGWTVDYLLTGQEVTPTPTKAVPGDDADEPTRHTHRPGHDPDERHRQDTRRHTAHSTAVRQAQARRPVWPPDLDSDGG